MTDTPISLASLMLPSKTVEMDYPGYPDLSVSLCFLSREENIKLRKVCLTNKYNKKSHVLEEELDEEKFLRQYASAVVKGWKGLKYKYLEEFLLVDVSNLDPDDELPYTTANAEMLMKNAQNFDSWVVEAASELENFTDNK